MPSISLPQFIEKQKIDFFKQIPHFLNEIKTGKNPLHDQTKYSLEVIHEIEVLLTLLQYLDEFNQTADPENQTTEAEIKSLLLREVILSFTFLDDNGFVPGYDTDGKAYATNYHFFTSFVLLNAIQILGENYHPKIKDFLVILKNGAQITQKIIGDYSRYQRKAYRGLNLIFIDIATLYRFGEYFNEQEWKQIAINAKDRIMTRFDKEEGYMPDYRDEDEDLGPSSSYSLYSLFTVTYLTQVFPLNDIAEKLKKWLIWNLKIIFPNGQPIETFDERGRHKAMKENVLFHPLFHNRSPLLAYTNAGREYLSELTQQTKKQWTIQTIASDLFHFKFFNEKNPDFIKIINQDSSDWSLNKEHFVYTYKNKKASILKNGNWIFTSQGYLGGPIEPLTMWHRELQQHIGTFYKGIGTILGSGNSLGQPEFSTLRTSKKYLCDEVRVFEIDKINQKTKLSNGDWQIIASQTFINTNEAQIKCEILKKDEQTEAFFQIPIACYDSRIELYSQNQTIVFNDKQEINCTLEGPICIKGKNPLGTYIIEITSGIAPKCIWPIVPVDIRIPGIPPMSFENAVAPLIFNLNDAKEGSFEISIKVRWVK